MAEILDTLPQVTAVWTNVCRVSWAADDNEVLSWRSPGAPRNSCDIFSSWLVLVESDPSLGLRVVLSL
jgi:hypothetical protein